MKDKKFFLLCIAVVILASVLRLWRLGEVPVSMSDDETRLVESAYSIWKTGKDLNGRFLPLAFPISGYAFNPVAIYLTAPFVGLGGLTMFVARLPFALAGILTVILVYLLSEQLFKNKPIALLAATVLAVSPWHLQLSRFAYEGGMALFFYTLGTYLFLRIKKKQLGFLFAALASFILGFYSYSGFKLTLVPILLVLAWYKKDQLVKRQLVLIAGAIILAFGSLYLLGKTQGALTYGGSLVFFQDTNQIETAVELERRASAAPELFKRLYHNKLTYIWSVFAHHYLYAFSPQYLLTDQEASGIFSMWGRGQLYYAEGIFLLFGILALWIKKRRESAFVLFLLAAAALPAGLGPEPITYTIRASFMLPWLVLSIGAGVVSLGTLTKKATMRWGLFLCVGALYAYFVGGYLTQYYFDWSRDGAKYYSKADADLAALIVQRRDTKREIVVAGVAPMTFLHYAFRAKLAAATIQRIYAEKTIVVGNVTFKDTCIDLAKTTPTDEAPPQSLSIVSAACFDDKKLKIPLKATEIIRSQEQIAEWYVFAT
ncbi:glycosyltransferase family 39 protein [Candidatus Gottesmanbacteria bacterium]|nr:glycosyltransferase family 39 protein [Candidatus Gottesmanbacteria bacterium]